LHQLIILVSGLQCFNEIGATALF